jgi:heptosyltransferase-3
MKTIPQHILISRTDSIGDVVLTMPLAGFLKKNFPQIKISFLGKEYTRPVIEACRHVDRFIEINDFLTGPDLRGNEKPDCILHVFPVASIARRAKQMKIPIRIGTSHRIYHWFTCTKRVHFSRRKSNLHEAQLNFRLLEPFGMDTRVSLEEISSLYGFENIKPLHAELLQLIAPGKYNLILHPKSQGNSREWEPEKYISLIRMLEKERFKIFISGTEKEKNDLQPLLDAVPGMVTDIAGRMSLEQFISFIARCDGLLACSTGPLHIAAALGKDALGIYPPMRPIHPGRWAPVGTKAKVFVLEKNCDACKKNPAFCACINSIQPEWIKEELEKRVDTISLA